jgi:hypothetical protein
MQRLESAVQRRATELGVSRIQAAPEPADHWMEEARKLIVKRKRFGTLPLDDVAPDQREGQPNGAWADTPVKALYWCDGRRTLAEVIKLTQLEVGSTNFDVVKYFRFLEKKGYVEFVTREQKASKPQSRRGHSEHKDFTRRHSGQAKREPESSVRWRSRLGLPAKAVWIPAFAGMTPTSSRNSVPPRLCGDLTTAVDRSTRTTQLPHWLCAAMLACRLCSRRYRPAATRSRRPVAEHDPARLRR